VKNMELFPAVRQAMITLLTLIIQHDEMGQNMAQIDHV